MDRRQAKTRAAILESFNQLLLEKDYNQISIKEIIDRANIGRTTFYAHFETKDMLLSAMCMEIFEHIANTKPFDSLENTIKNERQYLEYILSHILYHLKYNDNNILHIVKIGNTTEFYKCFRIEMYNVFMEYLKKQESDVPFCIQLKSAVEAFIHLAVWWLTGEQEYSPEDLAKYFMQTINI